MPDDLGTSLWREICAAPDDDAPRLVYADWLEQTGDPENRARATLIQAQLALAALPVSAKAARAPHEAQVRGVMRTWRRRWLWFARRGERYTFHRGFIDGVQIAATAFAKRAKAVFEQAPLARRFRFPEASNELVELVKTPLFARVVHADLHTMCSCGSCRIEDELPHLFASPHAANLQTLNLADCRIDDANAKRLAGSAPLAKLVSLDLSQNRISADAARQLATALPASIDLRKNEISKAAAKALRAEFGTRIRV